MLLTIPHRDAGNHNGGQLQFGPDGRLWLATGDGGADSASAQDPALLLGKVIKLDVNSGAATVVAAGLRNPWRFSFDRANGQIVIADVGDGTAGGDQRRAGGNYGWPCREGSVGHGGGRSALRERLRRSRAREDARPSGDGYCSITGGYVVRDPGLPTLLGRYVYGDFCSPGLRSVDLANPASDAPLGLDGARPELVRRGHVRAAVRDVAGRAGVPAGGRRAVGLPGPSAAASASAAPSRRTGARARSR